MRAVPTSRRILGLALLPMVAVTTASVFPSSILDQSRAAATKVCLRSAELFDSLPPPATLADAQPGVKKWLRGRFADKIDRDSFPSLSLEIFVLEVRLGEGLVTALADGDGSALRQALASAHEQLATIDRVARKEKLPKCTGDAFGRAYIDQLHTLWQTTFLTGDFTTDANAACERLGGKVGEAFGSVDLTDLTNPAILASALSSLEEAYRAFLVDLEAIPPPAGSEEAYATFLQTVERAVDKLDEASDELPDAKRKVLKRIGRELSDLAIQVTEQAQPLGLTC